MSSHVCSHKLCCTSIPSTDQLKAERDSFYLKECIKKIRKENNGLGTKCYCYFLRPEDINMFKKYGYKVSSTINEESDYEAGQWYRYNVISWEK